jgi:hypothetical protein
MYTPRVRGRILFFLLVIICLFSSGASKRLTNASSGILAIDDQIRDSFPCVYDLLQQMIADKKGLFQDPEFQIFFSATKTKLIISAKQLSPELGGKSDSASFRGANFRDTIFLNTDFFPIASREYVASVVIHESMHAFITWCLLSEFYHVNGMDTNVLKKYFPIDWQWLTLKPRKLTAKKQHILMSENFLTVMEHDLSFYTNPAESPELRDSIVQSLTYGGLAGTAVWNIPKTEACYLHAVDVWARHLTDDSALKAQSRGCKPVDKTFLPHLHLSPLCQ